MANDEFEAAPGAIGQQRHPRPRTYLERLCHVAALQAKTPGRKCKFYGNRIGRGCGIGRVLSSRQGDRLYPARPVFVQCRIHRLDLDHLGSAKAHLRYIQREGAVPEGRGILYDGERTEVSAEAFLAQCQADRHQFRFVISARDAICHPDLRSFVRALMADVESDLGTRIAWVAADHFNTAHPHSHIVVRGKDDSGDNLIIAPEYFKRGICERAAEIMALDLGPALDRDAQDRRIDEIGLERFTSLDRILIQQMKPDRIADLASSGDRFQQSLRVARLQKLSRMGLAEEIRPARWRLAPKLEETLQRMDQRAGLIALLDRGLRQKGIVRSPDTYAIFDPSDRQAMVGRIIACSACEKNTPSSHLIVDAIDGRAHYVGMEGAVVEGALATGAIVSVEARQSMASRIDRTILAIAARNSGCYSLDIHLREHRSATQDDVVLHIRRLEAIQPVAPQIVRARDGTWRIDADYRQTLAAYERKPGRLSPVAVHVLSTSALGDQSTAPGPTWLDHLLTAEKASVVGDIGFGREVQEALRQRRGWLLAHHLMAQDASGEFFYPNNLLSLLRQRERLAHKLSPQRASVCPPVMDRVARGFPPADLAL